MNYLESHLIHVHRYRNPFVPAPCRCSLDRDEERNEFIAWLSNNPLAGGMGKRGGARVIYFNHLASGDMVLLWIYTKAKLDNIRPEFLLTLKEQFNDQND